MVSSQPTLVLICKRPVLGHGKQRLAASLGDEFALRIAKQLLNCALEDLAAWPGAKIISPYSSQDALWAASLLGGAAEVACQGEGNLGARLLKLDKQLRQEGHREIIYMGSDAPMLTAAHFREAAQVMASTRVMASTQVMNSTQVMLSAAKDGGVVLMGAASAWPDLEPLPWSTEHLGSELDALCRKEGMSVQHITPGYDIDIEQDLHQLIIDLRQDQRPGRAGLLALLDDWVSESQHIIPQSA